MNKTLTRILALLLGLSLLTALGLFAVDFCSFRRSFYEKEYSRLNTASDMGMSHAGLMEATDTLLDYLKDSRDDLDLQTTVHGETMEMFDAREKAHMVDVKALYRNAMTVAWIAAGLSVLLILILAFGAKKHRRTALKWVLAGFGLFMLVLGAAAIYAAIDFNSFWTNFHRLFFDNDLWLLYPEERLIQMVPEQFFSDLVTRIVALFAAIAAALTAGNLIMQKRYQKRASLGSLGEGAVSEAD